MDDFREKGGKKAAKIGIIANTFLTILNISFISILNFLGLY